MLPTIDIKNLALDAGAHVLIKLGLQQVKAGQSVNVIAQSHDFLPQIETWCRDEGHKVKIMKEAHQFSAVITRGHSEEGRWKNAARSGPSSLVLDEASLNGGLAARGAFVEAGIPQFHFQLNKKNEVWSDNLKELYQQSLSAQWSPDKDIDWNAYFSLPDEVEQAIVQVMTFLVENEQAALIIPARFLGQLHPHYHEIQALLALQITDEARHIEVFMRRIRLKNNEPALSTVGGQTSLKTLLDQTDFSVAGFLLSVLGEGTFVTLLNFLNSHAPDPVTKQIAKLAARDEARHVAFGMNHLLWRLEREPRFREQLASQVQARNDELKSSSGLNNDVFDSLIILAAGGITLEAIAMGYQRVQKLIVEMNEGRRTRLIRLGFSFADAEKLAALHTRNFM